MNTKKIEITILKETEKAIMCGSPIIVNGYGSPLKFWLPKSQIKITTEQVAVSSKTTIEKTFCELPEWLLRKVY